MFTKLITYILTLHILCTSPTPLFYLTFLCYGAAVIVAYIFMFKSLFKLSIFIGT